MNREIVRPSAWREIKQFVADAWFPILIWLVILFFVGEAFFSWLHGHAPMMGHEPPYERGP